MDLFTSGFTQIGSKYGSVSGATGDWGNGMLYYILFGIVLVIISGSVAIYKARNRPAATPENVNSQKSMRSEALDGLMVRSYMQGDTKTAVAAYAVKRATTKEGFQTTQPKPMEAPLTADEDALVNYQPFSILQPGFVGPAIDGVYDEVKGVTMALDKGARCFVLPIDFHEMPTFDPKLFAPRGAPCLLYRDAAGILRSLNSGSIQKIAETLANYGFSNATNYRDEPMILILYFVRAPDKDSDTARYLEYLSAVAKALSPLIPFHLNQTPEGAFTRQARQDELLYLPLKQFSRKVLIFTNADTTPFRNTAALKLPRYAAKDDLDYLVHLRMFKTSTTPLGVTQMADEKQFARGIIDTASYFTVIPPDRVKQTTDKTKIQFTLALPDPDTLPLPDTVASCLNTMGTQCLPLNLGLLTEENKDVLENWKKNWRVKPKALRFTRPKPIVPMQPSPKLDANGGQITSPKM